MKKFEQAKHFLRDLRSDHFNLHLGANITNLYELGDALDIIEDKSFDHHVSSDKNDFANWVRDIIGDEQLANHLDRLKTKESMLKAIDDRTEELEKVVESGGWNSSEFLTSGATDFAIGIVIGVIGGFILSTVF